MPHKACELLFCEGFLVVTYSVPLSCLSPLLQKHSFPKANASDVSSPEDCYDCKEELLWRQGRTRISWLWLFWWWPFEAPRVRHYNPTDLSFDFGESTATIGRQIGQLVQEKWRSKQYLLRFWWRWSFGKVAMGRWSPSGKKALNNPPTIATYGNVSDSQNGCGDWSKFKFLLTNCDGGRSISGSSLLPPDNKINRQSTFHTCKQNGYNINMLYS